MTYEFEICRFCKHRISVLVGKNKSRLSWRCELGQKRLRAYQNEDFTRCKSFEANEKEIARRCTDIAQMIRNLRDERVWLERLQVYVEHKRRLGAEYHPADKDMKRPYQRRAKPPALAVLEMKASTTSKCKEG